MSIAAWAISVTESARSMASSKLCSVLSRSVWRVNANMLSLRANSAFLRAVMSRTAPSMPTILPSIFRLKRELAENQTTDPFLWVMSTSKLLILPPPASSARIIAGRNAGSFKAGLGQTAYNQRNLVR